ncbi:hypothetical protein ABW21_db0200397 [Orbilia brochopaga]|nr:hypothetical protein ABW21_db0200397 [Drechslerella brochopaga]
MVYLPFEVQLIILEAADAAEHHALAGVCRRWRTFLQRNPAVRAKRYSNPASDPYPEPLPRKLKIHRLAAQLSRISRLKVRRRRRSDGSVYHSFTGESPEDVRLCTPFADDPVFEGGPEHAATSKTEYFRLTVGIASWRYTASDRAVYGNCILRTSHAASAAECANIGVHLALVRAHLSRIVNKAVATRMGHWSQWGRRPFPYVDLVHGRSDDGWHLEVRIHHTIGRSGGNMALMPGQDENEARLEIIFPELSVTSCGLEENERIAIEGRVYLLTTSIFDV